MSSLNRIQDSEKELAPVVFFAFNRPSHTQEALLALSKNDLAQDTDLFVFIDGPRGPEDFESISQVNLVIAKIVGFKSIQIIHRPYNYGLAKNIVEGVSDIIARRGKVIVLEDDILTSEAFLNYMNNALSYFQNEKKVWHISGYMEPINSSRDKDTFFWRAMDCWGWGTWDDRWKFYEKNPAKLISEFSKNDIYLFNLEGSYDFWSQILNNLKGEINSWAIFWYAVIFKNNGLCLSPYVSYSQNIGFDGSGVHCNSDLTKQHRYRLNATREFNPPKAILEDLEAINLFKEFQNLSKKRADDLINSIEPIKAYESKTNFQENGRNLIKKIIPSSVGATLRKSINFLRRIK